jgi:hypothetical protein
MSTFFTGVLAFSSRMGKTNLKNTLAFRTFTARLGSISSSMLACIPDQLNVHEKHYIFIDG